MKYLITENQLKKLFEQSEPALEPKIAKFFKLLNEEKKKNRTRASLLQAIKNMSPYLNIPEGNEIYLLELYLLNYRKDGNYSSITKENFVDPRYMKGKWTPNTKSDYYTKAQLPFKGSNLEGYWTKDRKGNPIYVVKSYGWYPIYIYKDGIWYEVTKRYSSSTGRQMSRANPVEWSEELHDKVYLLSQDEMKMVINGATHDEIMKHKLEKIKSDEPELVSNRTQTIKPWRYYGENQGESVAIKYKVKSIDIEGDKAVVNVDIYDVLKKDKETGKGLKTPENYLNGEIPGVDKNYVEDKVSQKIKERFRDYIGPRYTYFEPLGEKHKVKFNFNHLRK